MNRVMNRCNHDSKNNNIWRFQICVVVLNALLSSKTCLCSFHSVAAAGISTTRCASSQSSGTSESNEGPCAEEFISWPGNGQFLRKDVEKDLYNFLFSNIMPFDEMNAETLGFHDSSSNDHLPDGLSNGIVGPTIQLALDAKRYPWTNHVPKDVYFEFIGSFANVNEARNNWRPLFHDTLQNIIQPLISNGNGKNITVEHIVQTINQEMWDKFNTQEPIYFKSGQTPLIYDPMSIITYGYASCTGLSIFLIDALRTVGIPARLAGTPAWNGKEENGNHSWVEFYGSDSNWHIMEAKPASGGDDENLWDPCQWWFCNSERMQGTSFYAAKLNKISTDPVAFPLAWDVKNEGVVGEDRTDFMKHLCSRCSTG